MHLKRNNAPKTWPVERKGSVYLVVPSHGKKEGIPLLIVMREILKIVKNTKEAEKILHNKKVKINNRLARNVKLPLMMFDKLEIGDKIYQIIINKNRKFDAKEVKSLDTKIVKIINKKILKKGTTQINLSDGRNFLSEEKLKIGDSAVINLTNNKIEKILPLKENAEVVVIGGRHIGKTGQIKKINKKLAIVKADVELNINLDNLMVI